MVFYSQHVPELRVGSRLKYSAVAGDGWKGAKPQIQIERILIHHQELCRHLRRPCPPSSPGFYDKCCCSILSLPKASSYSSPGQFLHLLAVSGDIICNTSLPAKRKVGSGESLSTVVVWEKSPVRETSRPQDWRGRQRLSSSISMVSCFIRLHSFLYKCKSLLIASLDL